MLRPRPALLLGLLAVLLTAPGASASSLVDVPIGSPGDVAVLERLGLDVTHDVTPRRARVLVHGARDARVLRGAGYVPRVVVRDVSAVSRRAFRRDLRRARAAAASGLPSGREPRYRVLSEYVGEMEQLAQGHAGLVRSLTLPVASVEGRPITGVEVASNVNREDDGRPVFAVFGLHHAREWPSGEVALEFAHDLASSYGVSSRVTQLLDRVRVIVVPVVNPDGFVASRGTDPLAPGTSDDQRRKNCAPTTLAEAALPCAQREGVDLNRNYSAGWGGYGAHPRSLEETYRGPSPLSEPEARAVHELLRSRQVTGVQSLHNIVGQVLRQPGFRDYGTVAPDEERMKALGDRIAAASGYESLHAHELYEVNGATEDWSYIAQGSYGYTIELGPRGAAYPPIFHGSYGPSVVDQYLGQADRADDGVREGLLLAAEAAGSVRDHAVLAGEAPPDALLRVRRDFVTETARICPDGETPQAPPPGCTESTRSEPLRLDDHVESRLRVPADGRFTWHVGPSTRPWIGRDGTLEAWTLSCSLDGGATWAVSEQVVVGRGQTASVAPCAPGDEPGITWTDPGTGGGDRALRVELGALRVRRLASGRALAVPVTVSGGVLRNARATFVDRRFRVLGSRLFTRLAGRRTVHVALRRALGLGRYRLTVRGAAADGGTVVATARLVLRRRR